jgi:hypothetical protein
MKMAGGQAMGTDDRKSGKENDKMKRISDGKLASIPVVLVVVMLVLALMPGKGLALTADQICAAATSPSISTDSDGDGITDYYECNGFTAAGILGNGSGGQVFVGYKTRGSNPRDQYLDPTTKDVFFALSIVGTNSLLDNAVRQNNGALNYYAQGLGITVHQVQSGDLYGDRVVFYPSQNPFQRAVMVTESSSTLVPATLGETFQGTPNGQDGSKIYTRNIQNTVNQYCPSNVSESNCKDASGVSGRLNVTNRYILQVLSHEVSHASGLAPTKSTKYGWHYAPQSVVMMEPSVKVVQTTSGKVVTGATFYIMTGYNPADPGAATIAGGY